MKTHHDLHVWNKSIDLVTNLYRILKDFPKNESYELGSQMRRSAVSIPSNIAEGASRNSIKEYLRFLSIAVSSGTELETHLIISKNVNLLDEKNYSELMDDLKSILKMLQALKNNLKKRI
jgi:four helix bundle protein